MPKTTPFEKHVDQYEMWFEKYPAVYNAELRAVKELLPDQGLGLEIGVGTGRFAAPLGIGLGLEPSVKMAKTALQRDIRIGGGVAENLPFKPALFDFVLMVTTVCFLDDIRRAFREVRRVLKKEGVFVTGFVDRLSFLGQIYSAHQNENVFYRDATFYSVDEIIDRMRQTGFENFKFRQTIFRDLSEILSDEPIRPGYGSGSFVVVQGSKDTR
ncbi:MAG: class I SAM-dependent methyltransferase [Desulfosarcina sp.]|nr:class I SAM-dependent methyltransferase [Desulfobacterales bacterium]